MKIGDKVKVTYTNGDQFLGVITGETTKMWYIDFDGEDQRRINKTMDIVLVDNPKTPEKEVITSPSNWKQNIEDYKKRESRSFNWKIGLIIFVAIAFAAVAILVGLDVIAIGEGGIHLVR